MFEPSPATRRILFAAGIASALSLAGGCTSDTGGKPFAGMQNPLEGSIRNPFKRPTEPGFFALVRKNCASYSIGGQGLGALQETDSQIGTLTSKLYRGDISNDEYINLLLQQYPAEDANVPATGCVINQLDTCLSTDCQLTPSKSPELEQAEAAVAAEQQEAIDSVPVADRGRVDMMIDEADESAADLSSEP
ncbi:MAG: hypothetical protein WBG92_24965 [Thiohalocapsa sp.]